MRSTMALCSRRMTSRVAPASATVTCLGSGLRAATRAAISSSSTRSRRTAPRWAILAPAGEHQTGDTGGAHLGGEVGEDRGLVAVGGAHHDPPPRPAAAHRYFVFGDPQPHPAAFEATLTAPERRGGQVGAPSLVGDEADVLLVEPGEQLAVVAAPVEYDGEGPLVYYLADRRHDTRHRLGQVGRQLLGQKQQRAALEVTDVVAVDTRQRHPPL